MNMNVRSWVLFVILTVFAFILRDLHSPSNKAIYYPQLIVETLSLVSLPFVIRKIRRYEILFFLLILLMLSQYIFHHQSFRISTVLYTMLLGSSFLFFSRLFKYETIKVAQFRGFIKWMIIVLALVLFIQQVQTVIGIEVFNLVSDGSSKFKLNSLAKESSKLALMVPLLLYTYITLREIELNHKYVIKKEIFHDRNVWLLAIYTGFTCGSMTAFIAFPFFFIRFLNFRNTNLFSIVLFFILFILFVPFLGEYDIIRMDRIIELFSALSTGDIKIVIDEDPSAACRIVPTWLFFNSFSIFDFSTWLGHGIDASKDICTFMITDREEVDIGAMNIFSLFYDYGLVAGIIWIQFVKSIISQKWVSYEMFIYVGLFYSVTINHHLIWLFLMLMYVLKQFRMSSYNINNK